MISQTISRVAANQALIPLMTCIALVIFVVFFVAMLIWTSHRKSTGLYETMSQMPLADDRFTHTGERG